MGFLKRIGGAFKSVGKGFVRGGKFLAGRPELMLIARFAPIPYVHLAVPIVEALENRTDLSGAEKMRSVIRALKNAPELKELKESEVRWVIETALQVAESRVEFQEA